MSRRLPVGGLIDRARPLQFSFDGRKLDGFAGDSIASALLAGGVRIVGRSFKLHRPRGIVGAGSEDAGVLVERIGQRAATNLPPTMTPLEDGMQLRSLNAWPSAAFDVGAVAQAFAPLLPAGFYYKTFMRPTWHLFEPFVRHAAGLGRVPGAEAWQPVSESRFGHVDVLVVGAGPAGLTAALTAARAGASVMLVDDGLAPGGRLADGDVTLDGLPASAWVSETLAELAASAQVRVLQRSTVWGYHEHNYLTVLERAPRDARDLDFRHWKLRARQVILATGAIERSIAFENNDRPGIMLASAIGAYLGRYGVVPGRAAVVFANSGSGYGVARRLRQADVDVTLVEARAEPEPSAVAAARDAGIRVLAGARIAAAQGRRGVEAVLVVDAKGKEHRIACDSVGVAGGWNPAIHLASQSRDARVAWNDGLATFRAEPTSSALQMAGAANGHFSTSACLADGHAAAARALSHLGRRAPDIVLPNAGPEFSDVGAPIWAVPARRRSAKVFVDLANDVTTADLGLAVREGFDSIELIKRYTTAGMGVDQGKTGNVNVIGIVADIKGSSAPVVGTTTFRPPFTPVEFGAIAGARGGARLYPWRQTPLAEWHMANGAVMYEAGLRWQRPGYYLRSGETWQQAARREATAVRRAVGVYDGTPLGKFLLKGPGVPELLDLIYVNDFASLAARRGRYGVMLADDGLILDDGVTFRLDEAHWLLHASTGAADRVHMHIESVLNVHRPDLHVALVPVTSAWTNATLCGPYARDVLAALSPDFDITAAAFPFMAMREGNVAGIPARVFRVSWTGELSYEINTPPMHAPAMWEAIIAAGSRFGIMPVGSEANHILRVEAGYISTGHEVDGTADVFDLGLGGMVSLRKRDFIGKRSMMLRRSVDPVRAELVGLLPLETAEVLPEGAPITPGGARVDQEGFVSASVHSVARDRVIALGLLRDGRARIGETVHAHVYGRIIAMTVTEPVFHDADRKRVKS